MIPWNDISELGREGTEARFGGHELILLAGNNHKVKALISFEMRGPIPSERCNELAADRHISQLSLPASQPGCLAQPRTWRTKQDHLFRATSQPGIFDQCTLYD